MHYTCIHNDIIFINAAKIQAICGSCKLFADYVELDCREEGKVNLPEIHVTCYARGDRMELREAKLLQII